MTEKKKESPDEGDRWAKIRRIVLGAIPEAEGEAPPAVYAVRSRLSVWMWTAIGFVGGAALGFLLVLLIRALPETPALLLGFGLGVFLGAGVVLILASRISLVRRGGALVLLLSPLLLILAPFLLLGAGLFAAKKLPRPPAKRSR